eukprot:SAG11_NODE_1615_length_4578_cov_6.001786_3_plen_84_part_00
MCQNAGHEVPTPFPLCYLALAPAPADRGMTADFAAVGMRAVMPPIACNFTELFCFLACGLVLAAAVLIAAWHCHGGLDLVLAR